MKEQGETHRVVIDVGKRFCEITPGDAFVNNGDKVEFVNGTEARIVLYFGNKALFGVEQAVIPPGRSFGPVALGPLPPRSSFQYVVYSDQTTAFGVGGSSPRIIVMQ